MQCRVFLEESQLKKIMGMMTFPVNDDIPTLDVQKNDDNSLAVMFIVTHVQLSMPSEATFSKLQNERSVLSKYHEDGLKRAVVVNK